MSILPSNLPSKPAEDEPPPFLGTWPRVYAVVLGYLTALILLLYALTALFHY
jgi:hypothetical protein